MADTKISELTDAGDIESGDTVPVVRAGSTQRANVPIDTPGSLLTTGNIETGSWTPVLEGDVTAGNHTYSNQSGSYYKIGDLVFLTGRLELSSFDTNADGTMRVTGLPFGVSNALVVSPVFAGFSRLGATPTDWGGAICGRCAEGAIDLHYWRDSGGAESVSAGDVSDNLRLRFSMTYEASE